MVKKKFKARKGAHMNDKQAQVIGETIEQLIKSNKNEVTPEMLVDEARNPSSPLHTMFQWDDNIAAQNYRLIEARRLLGNIIEVTRIEGKLVEHKSFYNVVNEAQENVYVTLKTVVKSPNYTQQLISECQQYISAFNRTLNLLKEQIK